MRGFLPALVAAGAAVVACGSSGGTSGPPPKPCTAQMVPATVHLTVSGFSKCSCFNGTFTLTKESMIESPNGTTWASMPIMGCPGQTSPAYLKLSIDPNDFGIGITDQGSDPGSGDSDFAPVTGGTCSPFSLTGGGSRAGNINGFCQSNEDEFMTWSVTH